MKRDRSNYPVSGRASWGKYPWWVKLAAVILGLVAAAAVYWILFGALIGFAELVGGLVAGGRLPS